MGLSMRDLIIIGAGGLGCEVAWTVERINAAAGAPVWNILGFADDDPDRTSSSFAGYPMLGDPAAALAERPDAALFVAIGNNQTRAKVVARFADREFPILVDPTAQVAPSVTLRKGAYVAAQAVVSVGSDLGAFVIVNARAGVGHDCLVGDYSSVCPGVSLSGHTTLGAFVLMGTNSCTVPGISIGEGATVSAGTPALRNVAAGTTLSPFGTLKNLI